MSEINLVLDEVNEIEFRVMIEGTKSFTKREANFVLFNKPFNMQFTGEFTNSGDVNVVIPPMKSLIEEGSYKGNLEVIVDGRIFRPLDLEVKFMNSFKVTAEAVVHGVKRSPVLASVIRTRNSANSILKEEATPKEDSIVKTDKIKKKNLTNDPPPNKVNNKNNPSRKSILKQESKTSPTPKPLNDAPEKNQKNISEPELRNMVRNFLKKK